MGVHDIGLAVSAEHMAEAMSGQPDEEARLTLCMEVIQALADERVDDAFFWLLVFARMSKAAASERVRAEIDAYLRSSNH